MPNNIAEIILRVTTEGSENAQTLASQFNQLDQIGKQVATSMTSATVAQRTYTTELVRTHSQLGGLIQQWSDLEGQVDHFAAGALRGFSSASARVFTQMVEGSKNAGEAFRQFAESVLEEILQIIIQMTIANALASVFPFFRGGGPVSAATGFARGGPVWGAGTETSDSIPAMLSHNEYVQPAMAHRYYGTRAMEAIRTQSIPREHFQGYATGGVVAPPSFAAGGIAVRLAGGDIAFSPSMSFTTPPVLIGDDAMAAWLATSAGQRALDTHLASRTTKLARGIKRAGGHRQE